MNQDLLNKLYSLLQTSDDVASFSDGIHTAKNSLFKIQNKAILDEITMHLSVKFGSFLKDAVSESKTDTANLQQIKTLLDAISEALKGLMEISLILAIEPPQKTLDGLSVALKKTFGQKTVMSLTTDPEILGGAIIIANGHYLDYSLRKKLNIIFEARKNEIMQSPDLVNTKVDSPALHKT